MKEDDFFAPRPKLSRNEELIRGGAILYAVTLSLTMLLDFYQISIWSDLRLERVIGWRGAIRHSLLIWLVLVGFHLLFLMPAWRCYLFRRWACVALLFLTWIPMTSIDNWLHGRSVLLFIAHSLGLAGSFAFCWIVCSAWPNLKSGY